MCRVGPPKFIGFLLNWPFQGQDALGCHCWTSEAEPEASATKIEAGGMDCIVIPGWCDFFFFNLSNTFALNQHVGVEQFTWCVGYCPTIWGLVFVQGAYSAREQRRPGRVYGLCVIFLAISNKWGTTWTTRRLVPIVWHFTGVTHEFLMEIQSLYSLVLVQDV